MAKQIEVTTRTMDGKGNVKREIKLPFREPETLEEAVKLWGGDVCLSHIIDSVTIAFQANVRGKLNKEGDERMTDAKIAESMKDWKPGQRKMVDPKKKAETIKAQLAKMPADLRKQLLAELAKGAK